MVHPSHSENQNTEITTLLSTGETLAVEFKSDVKGLPDRELVSTVVAMANTEGGHILLGVEDDGTVTGVQPIHQDIAGLAALIANRTSPSVAARAELLAYEKKYSALKCQNPEGLFQPPKVRSCAGERWRRESRSRFPSIRMSLSSGNPQWGLPIRPLCRWSRLPFHSLMPCSVCASATPSKNIAAIKVCFRWPMKNSTARWG